MANTLYRYLLITIFLWNITALFEFGYAQTVKPDSVTVAIAPEYDRVNGFHRFLLGEEDWKAQIDFVCNTLTDGMIRKSIKLMPPNIYQISGESIVNKVIARRNNIKHQALRYYGILAHTVEIPTSDKNEYFDITNLPDGKLAVKINKLKKDGKLEQVMYQHTFDPDVTREIRLYGMDGKDVFAVHGQTSSPITVRMIGGKGKDTFLIDSTLTGKGRRYVYDRSDEKNIY